MKKKCFDANEWSPIIFSILLFLLLFYALLFYVVNCFVRKAFAKNMNLIYKSICLLGRCAIIQINQVFAIQIENQLAVYPEGCQRLAVVEIK